MDELLTIKDIAKQLGVPESNLRYYRNRIGELLPSVGRGRRRRYLPDAVEIFRKTIDLVSEGMSLERVYRNLSAEFPAEAMGAAGVEKQEELAEKIAEKIAEKAIGSLNEGIRPTPDVEGQGAYPEKLIDALLERIDAAMTAGEEKGRGEEKILSLEAEIRRLSDEIEKKNEAIKSFEEQIAEKERIIELQKTQLIDARASRLNITQELADIKALLKPNESA